jgi:hypothetical protein
VKFFKWKKILVVLGIMAGMVIVSSLTIRWPINTFPAIEGNILDATTGEPLENVVVSVNWIRSSPGPAGEITRTIRSDIAVTDKEGKYRIPRLWSFHLGSVFSRGYMGFYHPLYASKQAVAARERRKIIIGSPALKAYPEAFEYKDGIIHYDIELLSLEEKYVKAVESLKPIVDSEKRKKKLRALESSFFGFLGSYENAAYWMVLKDKEKSFDLENTFRTWYRIVRDIIISLNWPEDSDIARQLEHVKNKIRDKIGEK